MAYTKITDNCHAVIGVAMMDKARASMVEEGRTIEFVMEGGAEAIKCKDAKPDAVVVHRFHGVHGDANWEHMDAWGGPEAYIDQARKACNDSRIVFQFLNESGIYHADDKSGEMPRNIQCALQGLEYAHLRGQPIAINLDGTGGPDDTEVKELVPLIRRMNEINTERGYDPNDHTTAFAYLMHHEYYVQHDPRFDGYRDGRHQNHDPMLHTGDDPANMLQYNNWYVGRYARVMYILKHSFGLDTPPIIVGEWGADDVISQYHGAWPPDWKEYWLSEEVYAGHLTWLSDNVYDPRDPANPYYEYAKNVVGMCIFSYGNSGGWEGCDYSQKGVFKKLLRDYAIGREPLQEGQPPVEPDLTPNEPIWTDYVVKAATLNVRAEPKITGVDIGDLHQDETIPLDVANPVEANNYLWLRHAFNGQDGWSAVQTLDGSWYGMAEVEQPDPPVDPPQDPPTGEPFTDDQMTVLAGLINVAVADAMQQQQATIAAAVDEALKPYRLHAKTMEDAWGSLTGYTIEDAA